MGHHSPVRDPHSPEPRLGAGWGLCGLSSVDSSTQQPQVSAVPQETCLWWLKVVTHGLVVPPTGSP